MAERRLFSKQITESDAFLDMPLSTQALYFHLGMQADDEGFVNAPKRICRTIQASEDDLKLLITKKFLIAFDSGVIVIKHWHINNTIQKDRVKNTEYQEEKAMLSFKPGSKIYTISGLDTKCIQNVSKVDTNCIHNLNQSNLNQNNIKESNINQSIYQSVHIADGLTNAQWDFLEKTYEDVAGLIDLIDERLKLSKEKINNPYAYIISVARRESWRTK